jgi:hypothetical protein
MFRSVLVKLTAPTMRLQEGRDNAKASHQMTWSTGCSMVCWDSFVVGV